MPPRRRFRLWIPIAVLSVLAAMGAAMLSARDPSDRGSGQSRRRQATSTIERRDFVRSIRLSGTVEAVDSTTIPAPRLRGPNTNSLVITRLVRPARRFARAI
jgi:hypothetical protein